MKKYITTMSDMEHAATILAVHTTIMRFFLDRGYDSKQAAKFCECKIGYDGIGLSDGDKKMLKRLIGARDKLANNCDYEQAPGRTQRYKPVTRITIGNIINKMVAMDGKQLDRITTAIMDALEGSDEPVTIDDLGGTAINSTKGKCHHINAKPDGTMFPLEVGAMADIYEDPLTEQKLEGRAKLIKFVYREMVNAGNGSMESWEVEFGGEPGSEPRVMRCILIPKEG